VLALDSHVHRFLESPNYSAKHLGFVIARRPVRLCFRARKDRLFSTVRLSSIDRTAMSRLRKYKSAASTSARPFRNRIHIESAVCDCDSFAAVCLAQIHDVGVQRNHAETQCVACTLHLFDLRCYCFVLDLSKHSALSVCVVNDRYASSKKDHNQRYSGRSGTTRRKLEGSFAS
jgi:hypothetical protein